MQELVMTRTDEKSGNKPNFGFCFFQAWGLNFLLVGSSRSVGGALAWFWVIRAGVGKDRFTPLAVPAPNDIQATTRPFDARY
jgi:hypothetical protein